MQSFTVDEAYSGVPGYVLGGYVAGLLAGRCGGSATVTLRAPLPIGGPVIATDDPLRLIGPGGAVIAEAVPGAAVGLEVPVVTVEDAQAASAGYPGHGGHLFPDCFCCGPSRSPATGLRIFPGPTVLGGVVAATWSPIPEVWHASTETNTGSLTGGPPDPAVPVPIVWAALDCPAIWALLLAADPDSTDEALTGRLEVELRGGVRTGETYVVVAWPLGAEARKRFAAAAILSNAGMPLAVCRQTMIVTGRGVPLGLSRWRHREAGHAWGANSTASV